jgi:ABC-type uncharacterized transport system ATPase component
MRTSFNDAKTRARERAISPDEIRGHITDVLRLGLSESQTKQAVLARVNGTDPEQLLAAALTVARELCDQKIRELKHALAESEEERSQLESDIEDLRNGLRNLLAEDK